MQSISYSRKQYALLGRLVANKRPEVARELFAMADQAGPPLAVDHSLISTFYLRFCKTLSIFPEEYRGALHKSSKVDIRRLFVGCMLHIYQPEVYVFGFCRINKGLVREIATVLHHPKQRISEMIREAIAMDRIYVEFRDKVDNITKQLTQPYEPAVE